MNAQGLFTTTKYKYMYDNKLVLTFNWKDGSTTVTLAELESANTDNDSHREAGNTNKAQ
jgi:hypothetical protein